MEKTRQYTEMQEVTAEEIEHAIRRAQQMRNEALAQLIHQFAGWLRRSIGAAAAWRPWTAGRALPLNH